MTNYSKTTKAQLIQDLEACRQKQRELIAQLDAVPAPPRTEPVPEASALADCIRALDKVTGRSSGGISAFGNSNRGEVSRVLRSLADKYGVTLVEVRTEPCTRDHLDEVDVNQLAQSLRTSKRAPGDPWVAF